MLSQVDGFRCRQAAALGEVVVQKKARANHPCRAQVIVVRQHEPQRPRQVRRGSEHDFAFAQRFAHQPEVVMLEVTQAAMDQLGAGRRSVRREIVLFAEYDLQAATRCVARDAGAIDTAADDQDIAAGTGDLGQR